MVKDVFIELMYADPLAIERFPVGAMTSCAVATTVKLKEDVAELFVSKSVIVFAPGVVGEKRNVNVVVPNEETGVAGVT